MMKRCVSDKGEVGEVKKKGEEEARRVYASDDGADCREDAEGKESQTRKAWVSDDSNDDGVFDPRGKVIRSMGLIQEARGSDDLSTSVRSGRH